MDEEPNAGPQVVPQVKSWFDHSSYQQAAKHAAPGKHRSSRRAAARAQAASLSQVPASIEIGPKVAVKSSLDRPPSFSDLPGNVQEYAEPSGDAVLDRAPSLSDIPGNVKEYTEGTAAASLDRAPSFSDLPGNVQEVPVGAVHSLGVNQEAVDGLQGTFVRSPSFGDDQDVSSPSMAVELRACPQRSPSFGD